MPQALRPQRRLWRRRLSYRLPTASNGSTASSKRRTEVVGIFPNDEAIVRLVGAILLEQNDEWAIQRCRYMTLETMAALSDDAVVGLPAMVI